MFTFYALRSLCLCADIFNTETQRYRDTSKSNVNIIYGRFPCFKFSIGFFQWREITLLNAVNMFQKFFLRTVEWNIWVPFAGCRNVTRRVFTISHSRFANGHRCIFCDFIRSSLHYIIFFSMWQRYKNPLLILNFYFFIEKKVYLCSRFTSFGVVAQSLFDIHQ